MLFTKLRQSNSWFWEVSGFLCKLKMQILLFPPKMRFIKRLAEKAKFVDKMEKHKISDIL
ncbi:hypothetical protein BH24ACI1_BH24ACI1_05580 [soil metagenome]